MKKRPRAKKPVRAAKAKRRPANPPKSTPAKPAGCKTVADWFACAPGLTDAAVAWQKRQLREVADRATAEECWLFKKLVPPPFDTTISSQGTCHHYLPDNRVEWWELFGRG